MVNEHKEKNRQIALEVARRNGVNPVQIKKSTQADLMVCGLGAGITMATCDHLASCYPWMGLWCVDLPGSIGIEKRVETLDYLGSAFPSLWILWCSLRGVGDYIDALAERNYQPCGATWLYIRGLGEKNNTRNLRGFRVLQKLWVPDPLDKDKVGLNGWPVNDVCERLTQSYPRRGIRQIPRQLGSIDATWNDVGQVNEG